MLSLFCLAASFAVAEGFSAPVTMPRSSAITMGVADMEGVGPETGGKVFDPMGFS